MTIASLPANNGGTITDVEYELDAGGSWVSSGGTTSFTISGLTASTSYDVRLRAVNSAGNGAAGNTETATSGASAPAGLTLLGNSELINEDQSETLDPFTVSATPLAGSNRCAILGITGVADGSLALGEVSVTWDGTSMTLVPNSEEVWNSNGYSAFFYILEANIPSAAANIVVSITTNALRSIHAELIQWSGVDQTTPVANADQGRGFATGAAETITVGDADSAVISAISLRNYDGGGLFTTSDATLLRSAGTATSGSSSFRHLAGYAYTFPGATGTEEHTYASGSGSSNITTSMFELREA